MSDGLEILLQTRKFRVERRRQTLADGTLHDREVVIHPGAVTILPVLPDGRICLIRNVRVAVAETLIELPAGTLEPGEDPAATAQRELMEETGYRAAHLEKLCEFFTSPGILSERMYVFLATDLASGDTALETGEQIEPLVVPLDQALQMIDRGDIHDAKTIAALLFYERFRQKVDA